VDEAGAWLAQALADRNAAELQAKSRADSDRCHAIAKCQQAVEKAIKGIIAALNNAGIIHQPIGRQHGVERFWPALIRLPRAGANKEVQLHLHGLLDQNTCAGIRALDALIPHWPGPGQQFGRNTEYPFQNADGSWTFPAAPGVFSENEVKRFRALAHRIVNGAERVVSTLRRRP